MNDAKNTDYIEKCFKQKLFRIKFYTKKSVGAYVLSPPGVELRGSKDCPKVDLRSHFRTL